MKKLIIATAALAVVAAATPAAAQTSATPRATAGARLIKPLTLERIRNLDFGTIVMGTMPAAATVSIAADGTVACPAASGLTCTGPSSSAQFRVTGTQGQVVRVASAPSFTLNGSNGGTLSFLPSLPSNFTLGNSGSPGNDFFVGGSIEIATNQPDGVYSGEIDIQVVYQ